MPSLSAHTFRFVLRHTVGRRFRNHVLSVAELRKLDAALIRAQRPPSGTTVVPETVGSLPAEWVRAPGAEGDAAVLYFHGGAFVAGSPATHRELGARVSAAAGAPVLALDYRLAPEHPYPAAVNDAVSAYRWLLDQEHTPDRLIIGGDSSGESARVRSSDALHPGTWGLRPLRLASEWCPVPVPHGDSGRYERSVHRRWQIQRLAPG